MHTKLAKPLKSLALLLSLSFLSGAATSTTKKHAVRQGAGKKKSPAVHAKAGATTRSATYARTTKRKASSRHSGVRGHYGAPVVFRQAALREVTSDMNAPSESFVNARALVPFFEQLYRAGQDKTAVHILQYGDSHTASDDWANTMRQSFQSRFGSGGPGFALAGHPYRGYRRFDFSGGNSSGWVTDGTVGHLSDGRYGLGGVSLTASSAGETVSAEADGDILKLCYLQQPGGGSMEIEEDGGVIGTVSTDGDLSAGFFTYSPQPGSHRYTVRTTSSLPVRLFGWISERNAGVTYETLGINGAQASMLADWDENILEAQIAERDPALILMAYGTNEALSPRWDAAEYRKALLTVVARFRKAAPAATIALIGPPDCFLRTRRGLVPFPHMEEVIRVEKQVARESNCAFWDWRERMGGPGSKKLWVEAGLSQGDYVHLTTAGYQMLGNTLFSDMMDEYQRFLAVRVAGLMTDRVAAGI